MQIDHAIRTRRTIHEYTPHDIPEGAVDRAISAAMWAPNHKLTWPWRFIKVGPKTRAELTELAVRLKCEKRELSNEMKQKIRAKVGNPAALVVVCQVNQADAFRDREDYGAISAAIQNLTLSLTAESVGSKWGTGVLTRHTRAYELLGVNPQEQSIVGFIWVGKATTTPNPPRRPDFNDVVRSVP